MIAPVSRDEREPGKARPLLAGSHNTYGARISPDGRFIAFVSDESGRLELYAAHFSVDDGVGRPVPLATLGRTWGSYQWSADGRSLFFASEGTLKSVAVRLDPSIRGGELVEIADFETLGAVELGGP